MMKFTLGRKQKKIKKSSSSSASLYETTSRRSFCTSSIASTSSEDLWVPTLAKEQSTLAKLFASELACYGINEEEFEQFIVMLNKAWIPCPIYVVISDVSITILNNLESSKYEADSFIFSFAVDSRARKEARHRLKNEWNV